MDKKSADELMNKSRDNYNAFAESFSQTRSYVWPTAKSLIGNWVKKGDSVLDIGCGNGRFYSLFHGAGVNYAGIDNSLELIAIARRNYPQGNFMVADALSLPFQAGTFDLAVSVAVLHHIPSREYRREFFRQAWRVLKPGGVLIVTVWDLRPAAMVRMRQWKRLKYYFKSRIKSLLGIEKLDSGDLFIPWQNKYTRYVHAFDKNTLKDLAKSAGFVVESIGILKLGAKEENLYIIAKKEHNEAVELFECPGGLFERNNRDMMKIGITGTSGAGKDTLAQHFMSQGFEHISLSDIIRGELKKRGLEITGKNLHDVGNELRIKEGSGVLAKIAVRQMYPGKKYVITSIRHPQEIQALKGSDGFVLFSVDAPMEVRYKRVLDRNERSDKVTKTLEEFIANEKREMESNDETHQQVKACMEMADFQLYNDTEKEALFEKADKMLIGSVAKAN